MYNPARKTSCHNMITDVLKQSQPIEDQTGIIVSGVSVTDVSVTGVSVTGVSITGEVFTSVSVASVSVTGVFVTCPSASSVCEFESESAKTLSPKTEEQEICCLQGIKVALQRLDSFVCCQSQPIDARLS